MLRGNLSTRPFYNERLVSLVLTVIALGAVALTAFNATQLRSLSTQRSEYKKQIDADTAEATRLMQLSDRLTRTVDATGMKQLWASAHEANDLIDKRTFSWTAFLSVIEKTLPLDARLNEVQPKPEKSVMHVAMSVTCKTSEDLHNFVVALEKSQAFSDVVPTSRSANDDGTETDVVEAIYLTPSAPSAPAATPAPAPAPKKSGRGQP